MLSRFSHVSLCETLGLQPSRLLWRGEFIGFSTQVYWSGLLCPLLGDLPDPGMKPCLLHLLHWRSRSFPLVPPGSVYIFVSKSWFIPFPLSPLVTRSLFTLSVNLFLFYKWLHLYHFKKFLHIMDIIWYLSFSAGLLYLVL